MEGKLCVNQNTYRAVYLEAPRALLDKLQELQTRPFGEVLLSLQEVLGRTHVGAIPLTSVAAHGMSAGGGVEESPPKPEARKPPTPEAPKLPSRAPVPQLLHSAPLPYSEKVLSHKTWPCSLVRYSFAKAKESCMQLAQVLSLKPGEELSLDRPVLKCTTFACPTFSNEPLLPCPSCSEGVMGLNCSLDGAGSEPQETPENPWPLTGDLVFQYPFLARREDWERGLDMKWEGTGSAGKKHGYFQKVLPGQLPPYLGRPIHWCSTCRIVHNLALKGSNGCPFCGNGHNWGITFVSAHPSDPKKRVYWPLGTIGNSKMDEPAERSSFCLLTDNLKVHSEVGPLGMMALLKAHGVFSLEEVDIITVKLDTAQIKRIVFFGLDHGNDRVLTEAFSPEILAASGKCEV